MHPGPVKTSKIYHTLFLHFQPSMRAWTELDISVLPKARKARALLALIALSEERKITRSNAAVTLWSNLDRAGGLARLRDTLYHLQQGFNNAGLKPLRLDGGIISFEPGSIVVEFNSVLTTDSSLYPTNHQFLEDLSEIDPAFDRWLARIREQRSQDELYRRDEHLVPVASRGRFEVSPSLVVTEFDADGTGEQFARVVSEEVGSALARLRWFTTLTGSVYGPSQSVTSGDLSQIADYVLVGTLQQDLSHYRLSLKVIDLNSDGAIVWALKLEQKKEPGFVVQENFANAVAARVDTNLLLIEAERWRRRRFQTRDNAYSLVLEAVPAIYRLERDPFIRAGHTLERAIAADQECAMAHSWLAYWHVFLVGQGWATNPTHSMARAGVAADRAMMLDPKDARAVTIAGHVKAFLSRRIEDASALHKLALELNPALALGWHLSGVTHAYAGRLDDAHRCISRCLELVPDDPHGFFAEGALGIVHLLRGDHEAAASLGRRVTERNPQFTSGYKSYLAALGHLGEKSEAAEVLQKLRRLEPRLTLQRFRTSAPYQRPEDLEHFTHGLRLAGLT